MRRVILLVVIALAFSGSAAMADTIYIWPDVAPEECDWECLWEWIQCQTGPIWRC
jgi:hypothetical protein